jgi:hypothetical protein
MDPGPDCPPSDTPDMPVPPLLPDEPSPSPSRLISKVLAPAVRLWLRSQLDHIEDLNVDIDAGDRQILSGHIRSVTLSARKAIYRGLHLSQVHLVGEDIQINLGQVMRGKPLRLQAAIPITGTLLLQEADLNQSLNAPLLMGGVTDFLLTLLRSGAGELAEVPASNDPQLNLDNLQIALEAGQVTLSVNLTSVSGNVTGIIIRTGFELASPHQLSLVNPQWLPHAKAKRGLPLSDLHGFIFDLGQETAIRVLTLEPGQVTCQGRLLVKP